MTEIRVALRTTAGIVLAEETFTTDSDATVYMNSLMEDEDKILEALDESVVTLSKEELYKGTWVPLVKKLVRIR